MKNLLLGWCKMDDKLYLVEVGENGELEYVTGDDGERVVICGMKDVGYEKEKVDSFFVFSGSKTEYKSDYFNNIGDFPIYTGSLNAVANIFPKNKEDIENFPSLSYNKDNDTGSTVFFHKSPYLVGGHHYSMFFKNEKKELNSYNYFYLLFLNHFQKVHYYQSQKPVANVGTIKQLKFPIPLYQATKEKSPTTDFSKIEKHLTDKDENSKLDDLMSYQLQMSIAKYIEDYNGSIDEQIDIIDKMIAVNEFKKEKVIDEIFDKESSISGEPLYEVEVGKNGELEYVTGDDGERVEICWMKDVEYEEVKLFKNIKKK